MGDAAQMFVCPKCGSAETGSFFCRTCGATLRPTAPLIAPEAGESKKRRHLSAFSKLAAGCFVALVAAYIACFRILRLDDQLSSLFFIAMAAPPIMLGLSWWGWFRDPRFRCSKWRALIFLSGLCAGTLNVAVWWAWVVWLQLHYTPDSWKVRDVVSDVGLWLLLFSIVTAMAGRGIYRLLLAISGVLAMLPWIPIGIL